MTRSYPAIGALVLVIGGLAALAAVSAVDVNLFSAGSRAWCLLAFRALGMLVGGALAIYAYRNGKRRLYNLSFGLFYAFLGFGQEVWFFLLISATALILVWTGLRPTRSLS